MALAERLARVQTRQELVGRTAEIAAIVRRGRSRAVLDENSADEILGYDSNGLPG